MNKKILQNAILAQLIVVVSSAPISLGGDKVPPIADAGSSRYAADDPVVLDGTGSYDPDNSGPLSYTWRQIAGPEAIIIDADTATPTISGLVQTNEIQECEFELEVWDGELTSLPDSVKVTIVPDFGPNSFDQENPPFDADKPTIVYFGGGDCTSGLAVDSWSPFTPAWLSRANIIYFPKGYTPDAGGKTRTYYKYGDMIIAYLSAQAPDYSQPIQTIGWSTGGQPAIDVGIHLNLTYADARYAINRVTFFDALRYCRDHYSESISTFLDSSVDGEQCWADAYVSATSGGEGFVAGPPFQENVLNVGFPNATGGWYQRHILASGWYANSLELAETNDFNHGAVGGAYWSVIGPGRNLQLAFTPGVETYKFSWHGDASSGYMDFDNEPDHPGRLPEPVILIGPDDGVTLDDNGAAFSCEESENAAGYQLLFGRDPRHMAYLFSDTPLPPVESVTTLPFEQGWWTVRAYDEYGSTIHADPVRITAESVIAQTIENAAKKRTYASIQQAIDDASDGQEIVISPGVYQYLENIKLGGKNLTLRSTDPNDPNIVAKTVIKGARRQPVVASSRSQGAGCVLDGLTITSEAVAIRCSDGSLTIRNCTIESTGTNSIEFLYEDRPTVLDCNILGAVTELDDPSLVAHWALDETEGMVVNDSAGNSNGYALGNPLWLPNGGQVDGALEFDGADDFISAPAVLNPADGPFSVLAWVKGGAPGQAIISETGATPWLSLDLPAGHLMTELTSAGRSAATLFSQTAIDDGNWHRIGLVWDGLRRILYVDDGVVAEDTQNDLKSQENGLYIGCGNPMQPGTFFSGLLDDIRIYNRAIIP